MALAPVTQVRVYNRALALLGSVNRTVNPDDDRAWTNQLNEVWDGALRDFLAEHPWNPAVSRWTLNKGVAPLFGEGYTYQLPADCVRWLPQAKDSSGCDVAAVIEEHDGKTVLIADGGANLYIRGIKLLEDLTRWRPHMVTGLAYRLAMDAAESITQSESIVEDMRVKYHGEDGEGGYLAKARQIDGLETGERDRGNVVRQSRALSAAFGGTTSRAPGR